MKDRKKVLLSRDDLVKDYETGELLLKSEAFEVKVKGEVESTVFIKTDKYDTKRDYWGIGTMYYKKGFEVNKDGRLIALGSLDKAYKKIDELEKTIEKASKWNYILGFICFAVFALYPITLALVG